MIGWYDKILRKATQSIGWPYFSLPVYGQDEPVYRERVYCYELYHQIRSRWDPGNGYTFCAEVDKSGHQVIRGNYLDNSKPDFLIHVPEDMDRGLLVMEVKSVEASKTGILSDIRKLNAYLAYYENAYYLIYGDDLGRFKRLLGELLQEWQISEAETGNIIFWHHSNERECAKQVPTPGLVQSE